MTKEFLTVRGTETGYTLGSNNSITTRYCMRHLHRTLGLVAVLTCAAILTTGCAKPNEAIERPLLTLEESLVSMTDSGWEIVKRPDLAGPYRYYPTPHHENRGGSGRITWKNERSQTSHRFTRDDECEQVAVPLETANGQLTVAVLRFKK